jgi:hypothetical protein
MAQRQNNDPLQPFARLLKRLGTSPEAIRSLPQITPFLEHELGSYLPRPRILTLLRLSESEEAKKFLLAYDSPRLDAVRDELPLEAFCAIAQVNPNRLLEILGGLIIRTGAQKSAIIAALHHPEIVEATVGYALTQDGIQDRNTMHKAVGFTPQPKGAQTTITVQTNAQAASLAAQQAQVSAPPPEQTIRTLVDRFHDAAGLKGSQPQLLSSNPHEELPEFPDQEDEAAEVPVLVPIMAPAQRLARKMFEHDKEQAGD